MEFHPVKTRLYLGGAGRPQSACAACARRSSSGGQKDNKSIPISDTDRGSDIPGWKLSREVVFRRLAVILSTWFKDGETEFK